MSRRQIDQLGARLRDNPQAEDISTFEEYRALFLPPLNNVTQTLVDLGLGSTVTRRIKRTESAIAKLRRQKTLKLSQMQDLGGCRLVVDNIAQQDIVCNTIGLHLTVRSIHDRRQTPSSGYRAVHVIVREGEPARYVEIQIRTKNQQLWAQISELASLKDGKVKYGGGSADTRRSLDQLSQKLWDMDQAGITAPVDIDDDTMSLRPYNPGSDLRRPIDVVLARIRPE